MQHCKFLICLATMVTNYSLVIDFVAYRHSVKSLDGIIIFQTQKFSSGGLERELQHQFHLPQVIVKNVAPPDVHHCMNNRNIALIFMEKLDMPRTWALVSESLRRRYYIPMVFISQASPSRDLQLKFFNYFTLHNMINTIVLFRANDTMMVRTSIPYPKLQIITVEPRNFSGFVWPKYRNVFGYNFRFSLYDDPPVVYEQVTNNNTELGGLTGQVLSVFVKRVNGTFTIVNYPMNDTMKRTIDLTANLVFRIDLVHRSMEPSYPMFQTKACLMLPIEAEIPLSWYLLYAFDISTWQMLGFTFFIIAIFKIGIHRRHDLVLHGLSVLQLFLSQSVLLPGIRSVTRALFIVYLGGLFVVIVSSYVGSLTSLFSTRVRFPAVRTPEDFLKTNLQIMSTDTERELYFDSTLLPTSLASRLFNVGSGTTAIERTKVNTSFAYIMTTYKWLWYEKPQMRLKRPMFRIGNEELCTPSLLHCFALQKQSPFREMIKILCLELQQLGFIDHWLAEVPPAEKLQLSDDSDMVEVPLSLAHFTLGFYILIVGWFLALATFVGELFVSRKHAIFASRAFKRFGNAICRK